MFLEGFTVQHAKERAILFILYLYLNDTRAEARKRRQKKCADLCEVGLKEGVIEQFFDLGLAAAVKTKDFHGLCITPLLLV